MSEVLRITLAGRVMNVQVSRDCVILWVASDVLLYLVCG